MTEMGHIAYHSIRLAKTNVLTPIPRLYLFLIKSYWQMTVGDLGWPQMTFGNAIGNVVMQFFTRIVHNCPIRYDSTQKRLRQSKYTRVDFLPIDL